MFRRILEMRTKLEGIIQLQTIKYQRQLAIMLRNTRRNASNAHESHSTHSATFSGTDAANAGEDGLNKKFGAFANSPFPSPIRTNVFTPSLAALPSPHNAHFAGSEFMSSDSESPTSYGMLSVKGKSGKSGKSNKVPRLGANIYAGNLKMMSSVDEHSIEEARQAMNGVAESP